MQWRLGTTIFHDGIESVSGQRLPSVAPMPTVYRCHVGNITKRRRQWPVRTWLAHERECGGGSPAAGVPQYMELTSLEEWD
ncbi:hypothetical protein RB213_010155 [Colletotrichum asianum]